MGTVCPLCQKRVSNWEQAAGKCIFVQGQLIHMACAQDYATQERLLERLKQCRTK